MTLLQPASMLPKPICIAHSRASRMTNEIAGAGKCHKVAGCLTHNRLHMRDTPHGSPRRHHSAVLTEPHHHQKITAAALPNRVCPICLTVAGCSYMGYYMQQPWHACCWSARQSMTRIDQGMRQHCPNINLAQEHGCSLHFGSECAPPQHTLVSPTTALHTLRLHASHTPHTSSFTTDQPAAAPTLRRQQPHYAVQPRCLQHRTGSMSPH